MKTALVMRHLAYEDLGSLEVALIEHDFTVIYSDPDTDHLQRFEPGGPDLVIVLGGPFSVNDHGCHPWITDEYTWLRERLTLDLPTLGICLGAQLMAKAMGARVYTPAAKEIGWYPLSLTPFGAEGPLRHFDSSRGLVLQWHGETFELPLQAKLLASTISCPNQAFQLGRNGLAVQFHPEVTAAGLEPWLVDQGNDLVDSDINAEDFRKQNALYAPMLAQNAKNFLEEWLVYVALNKREYQKITKQSASDLGLSDAPL